MFPDQAGLNMSVFSREVFYDAVVNTYSAFARSALIWPAFTVAEPLKSSAELLRHGVVDDGVDGAVGVNAHAAEEQEPGVEIRRIHERIHNH